MRQLGLAILLLSLLGCAAPATTSAPSATLPPNLRPEIAQHWLQPDGNIRWPADDGFAATPQPVFLPAGALIDRFGGDGGTFLSPKGAPYGGRALPYICSAMRYAAYRVTLPLFTWTGRAAPWF